MRYPLIILMALSFTLHAEDAAKPQPLEVQNAMASLEKSIVAARKVYDPIVAKAVGDAILKLNLVKADLMKKGDLEGTNLVVESIAKLKSGDVVGEIEANVKSNANLFADSGIVGKWSGKWGSYELKNTGDSLFNNDIKGKWTVNDNKLIVTWTNGYVETYNLPIKKNSLFGENQEGTKITITRVSAK